MAIWNLGSINIDRVYRVPHLPAPGETLAALSYASGLGGKGANQSVAAARAGAHVHHLGAVGPDGGEILRQLTGFGVDVTHVAELAEATGHAIINVDPSGENAIVLFPGANRQLVDADIARALKAAQRGDYLLMQNETSSQLATARRASEMGLVTLYSAAPFEIAALRAVQPFTSLLLMNEGEAEALRKATGALPETDMLITRGAKGATWISPGLEALPTAAFPVTPEDTTGAGDCFTGNLAAALDAGLPRAAAMRRAAAAAAIQVTRAGASSAMPLAEEVDRLLQ